ncbi:hypothetical protein [Micromonospora arborensis]|uniref:hypothetical protein n=1 Tax=Micromonospora arborensis TaxID=2116518 RepID=UPI0037210811
MTRGGRGRSQCMDRRAAVDHFAGVAGLVGTVAALIAAVAGLLTGAATLVVSR